MPNLDECYWCGAPFSAGIVGAHRKRFCSTKCKNEFHSAARRWAEQALADGRLSIADLQALRTSCTTRTKNVSAGRAEAVGGNW